MADEDLDASLKQEPEEAVDKARREALKRLGIYGAYTAPAMMVLVSSRKVNAKGKRRVRNLIAVDSGTIS
jgi:hypothetical protein